VKAVADRFAGELMESLRAGLRASTDPRDLLHATIEAYLAFVERDPEVYRFLVRQAVATRGSDSLGGFVTEIAREITVVLGEQLHQAGADTGGAEAWAHGMVGMVHMAGDWWIDRRTMPRSRLVAYLVDLLWDGLGTIGTRPGEATEEEIEEETEETEET
jgi:AcrR family transcriptional regulator